MYESSYVVILSLVFQCKNGAMTESVEAMIFLSHDEV
jgi:hypothetical protein